MCIRHSVPSPLSTRRTHGTHAQKVLRHLVLPNNAILVIVGNADNGEGSGSKSSSGDTTAKKMSGPARSTLEPIKAETLQLKTDQSYGLAMSSSACPVTRARITVSEALAVVQQPAQYFLPWCPETKPLDSAWSTLPGGGPGLRDGRLPRGAECGNFGIGRRGASNSGRAASARIFRRPGEAAENGDETDLSCRRIHIVGLATAWSKALAVGTSSRQCKGHTAHFRGGCGPVAKSI